MTKFQTKKHSYTDDEVKSALQKEIRRGNEQEAMYWALELAYEYDEEKNPLGKSSWTWLCNRLKIIVYEDIGIANPDVVLQVSKAVDDMYSLREKNNDEWDMALAHIILLLCRSEKNRINDYFKVAIEQLWDKKKMDIPDYALDMHTTRGNKMGRTKHTQKGIEHFINEGEKLENVKKVKDDDFWKDKAHKKWKER